ncbi:hypothetical protein EWM64_g2923 [Hericium alpestre]|uniref:Cytochrome P450 n=1 Tax=Hericium alpestre TaxID=135208 RepID=A0A4Z0A2W7_9AGAM|nr:hypothetical protein EWM64_g2923 [Hericium alpestre]
MSQPSSWISYGYEVVPKNDPIVRTLEDAADMISQAIFPGAMAVDAVPALQHLPEWLPGTYLKTYGRKCRHLIDEMLQAPLTIVHHGMVCWRDCKAIGGNMLQENEATEGGSDGLALVKEVGGSIYSAGTHTTSISLNVAIHALLLHPDVQRWAQNELDVMVGRDRLPSFADRQDLRYVNAICREVLRWKLVAPLGLPRTTRQDDVYEGLFIPKGTMLLPNAWAMLHDPEKYPDPEAFNPERFLEKNGELNDDDVSAAFGFGRRICPGRHLVLSTLFVNIACMLSVFNIGHKKDENGNDVPVNVVYGDGLTSTPSPWECAFTPRDEQAMSLLKRLMQDGGQHESK